MYTRLSLAAKRAPQQPAVVSGDQILTYAQLHARVTAFANGLLERGISAGQAIVLALPNGPEFVIAYLAASYLNACAVTLDPRLPLLASQEIVAHVKPFAVVTQGGHQLSQALSERILTITTTPGPAGTLFSDIATIGHRTTGRTVRSSNPALQSGRLAMLLTSGSTGAKKLIGRSAANQLAEGRNIASTCRIGTDDTILCAVPMYHALGQYCCLALSVYAGATLVLLDRPEGGGRGRVSFGQLCSQIVDLVRQHQVTVLPLVPAMLEAMVDLPVGKDDSMGSMRYVLSGSNFLDGRVDREFRARFGVPVRQTYGSSEVGTVAWNHGPVEQLCPGSVGRPLDGVSVRLVDSDGEDVPAHKEGEIAVRSASVAEASLLPAGQRYLPGGWALTGDVGRIDHAGRLFIVGRTKLFIETRRHKVNPHDVETVIRSHPGVRDVVVVPETIAGRTVLVALVVAGGDCSPPDIIAHCEQRLPFYMVPAEVRLRSSLPRDGIGKLLRQELGPETTIACEGSACTC